MDFYYIDSNGLVYTNSDGCGLVEMKQRSNKYGYKQIGLWCKDKKKIQMEVHRIVALAFIPNKRKDRDKVNHIDEDKHNNTMYNLEWCTCKENNNHGTRNERVSKKLRKKVFQFSLIGEFIAEWDSVSVASTATDTCKSEITSCCRGKSKTANGFVWRYYTDSFDKFDSSKNYHTGAIHMFSLQGDLLKTFKSTKDVYEFIGGKRDDNILQCCRGRVKTVKGYVWRFEGDTFDKYRVRGSKNKSGVVMMDLDGNVLMEFESVVKASEYVGGANGSSISACCNGRQNTAYGCTWKYKIV